MKTNTFIICALGLAMLIASCKNDSTSSTKVDAEFTAAENNYKNDPTPASGIAYLSQISRALGNPDLVKENRLALLENGLNVCTAQNILARKGNFLFPLIKEDYNGPKTTDRIYELANLMGQMKKSAAADILYKGLVTHFPNYGKTEEAKAKISEAAAGSSDDYIKALGEKIFENPDDIGVNRNASLAYVDACEAYGLVNPKSAQTPEHLFKAAEVAKSIRTFPKSLSLYDWIIDKYPGYEKAPTALFLKGFIIENNIKDDSLALKVYQEFKAKYPDHNLADDAQFLIENIGKTDEEILKMIESKREEK